MLGSMAGAVTEQRDASFDRGRHTGNTAAPPSPLTAPPKLFSAGSGVVVSGASSLLPAEAAAAVMSPTSTLQVAAAVSPAYPAAATAVPFSRRCKSRSSSNRSHHRPAWDARQPAGLGLAGALHGGDAVPPAATVLTGQAGFRSPAAFAAVGSAPARSLSPQGRRRRLMMSPREMEASEGYTRVIARGGPCPRTTHIFDDRVVVVDGGGGCGLFSPGSGGDDDEFLRWCHGCSRDLGQGKDIFMYRGEMAFCSDECRYRKMLLFDEE